MMEAGDIKRVSDADMARRALTCLDLTDLVKPAPIAPSMRSAQRPRRRMAQLRRGLPLAPVRQPRPRRFARLAGAPGNFPAGGEDIDRVTEDVEEALGDGAREIDLVMPYG